MSRDAKIGVLGVLFALFWQAFGFPYPRAIGWSSGIFFVVILVDVLANKESVIITGLIRYAPLIVPTLEVLMGVAAICFVIWARVNIPLSEDARKFPPTPPAPKAPHIEKVPPQPKPAPPTAKNVPPQKPPEPQSAVQVIPAYGNLKERCQGTARMMAIMVQKRYEFQADLRKVGLTPELMREWERGNDTFYRFCCQSYVDAMHGELAEVHLRDTELDEILSRDADNDKFRRLQPGQPFYGMGWLSIYDEEKIGARLEALAARVPSN
jgi:hypothetical protein